MAGRLMMRWKTLRRGFVRSPHRTEGSPIEDQLESPLSPERLAKEPVATHRKNAPTLGSGEVPPESPGKQPPGSPNDPTLGQLGESVVVSRDKEQKGEAQGAGEDDEERNQAKRLLGWGIGITTFAVLVVLALGFVNWDSRRLEAPESGWWWVALA